jgi:hypothetical protein
VTLARDPWPEILVECPVCHQKRPARDFSYGEVPGDRICHYCQPRNIPGVRFDPFLYEDELI